MKTLFALLWLSAMIWLAAPAHAHPDEGGGGGDDVGFLAALQNAGITYSNPDQAIGSAKAVCWCLDGGESSGRRRIRPGTGS